MSKPTKERENQMDIYVLFADHGYADHQMLGVYDSLDDAVSAVQVYLQNAVMPELGFFAERRVVGGAANEYPIGPKDVIGIGLLYNNLPGI